MNCLKRRENWPEQFINALEACEHRTLANEIRAEYDALRGINSKSASQVPTALYYNVEFNVCLPSVNEVYAKTGKYLALPQTNSFKIVSGSL